MAEHDVFADRERALEEEFFRRRERELIEKMRRRAALGAATGLTDQELLNDLEQLGYTRETVTLLHLMPLVLVAWAEGGVSERERALILEAARLRNVEPGSAAYEQLTEWLERRPSKEVTEKTLRLTGAMLQTLPPEEREATTRDLVAYCTQVAEASGGILEIIRTISDEERAMIKRIVAELERNRPDAAQQIINR